MSYIHTKLAWQLDIPSTDKLVLLALCHFADEEGHCYPSVTTVARMVGITRRHCQRLMSELINQSFVAVVGNERGGVRTRDYMLSLPALRKAAAGTGEKQASPVASVTPLRVTSARKPRDTHVSRTTRKTNQSETPPPSAQDVEALDWSCLPLFSAADKVVVVELLGAIDPECRQDLVDELGGALRANAIRGQWPGWLRAVARRAKEGGFMANHALAIQQDRRRAAREVAEAKKRRAQAARRSDPAAHTRNLAAMRAVIAELSKPSLTNGVPREPESAA